MADVLYFDLYQHIHVLLTHIRTYTYMDVHMKVRKYVRTYVGSSFIY